MREIITPASVDKNRMRTTPRTPRTGAARVRSVAMLATIKPNKVWRIEDEEDKVSVVVARSAMVHRFFIVSISFFLKRTQTHTHLSFSLSSHLLSPVNLFPLSFFVSVSLNPYSFCKIPIAPCPPRTPPWIKSPRYPPLLLFRLRQRRWRPSLPPQSYLLHLPPSLWEC